jgi:hypothetical protein
VIVLCWVIPWNGSKTINSTKDANSCSDLLIISVLKC